MRKSTLKTYLNKRTDVYHLVDQFYLSKFEEKQGNFMIMRYYEFYCSYCKEHNVKIQSIDRFLLNASRKKIKIIQVCCPYCGRIEILVEQKKCRKLKKCNTVLIVGKNLQQNMFFCR